MFERSDRPRVFGLPPGTDFARQVIAGLVARTEGQPDALARTLIVTNTRRLQRRMRDCLAEGPARLHPRIRVLSEVALDPVPGVPLPLPPLRRRLELMQLVKALIAREPDIAPASAAFDLADSLARLFEEMHGEGVSPADVSAIEVPDTSGHWLRTLNFVDVVARFVESTEAMPDVEARLRAVALRLADQWATRPPDHPILLVGSTGSRGATSVFMDAVARLPQGAVILPGFDTDMPEHVWSGMDDPALSEDHPQYRFRHLMDRLGLSARDIGRWTATAPPVPARNALVSLSLRPAPVTDQWLEEAPRLRDLETACADMTVVIAGSRREEAEVIALRLRKAAEDGQSAALVTPDRQLTRQVAAALDRWDIVPDDSAGTPLAQSPPARLLLHLLDGMTGSLTAETLLIVLKHPLVATGGTERGAHLRLTRELELWLRRTGVPYPDAAAMREWAAKQEAERIAWATWVIDLIASWPAPDGQIGLEQRLTHHLDLAERAAAGPGAPGSAELWAEAAGRSALSRIEDLRQHAGAAEALDQTDYAALITRILSDGEVRDRDAGHPLIRIWGTLEARVQSADLVILGSMNEGIWPEIPAADPWLNRQMRRAAGLLLPERRIGLSAHDYQQAMGAREVWITRSVRSDDAQTVPSRWVSRLTNLLGGLPDKTLLTGMQERGNAWLATVRDRPLDPVPKERRPSPRPPDGARPMRYSVTEIEGLTRDPYAIYARKVLGLNALFPLQREADALLRGIVVHGLMERFVREEHDPADPATRAVFLSIASEVLLATCPWPTARALWLGRIERVADWFLMTEVQRRTRGCPHAFEAKSDTVLPRSGVTLVGKPDRIDRTPAGEAVIYDYKTGAPPSPDQQAVFNPQLLLLSAMAERGAFADLGPVRTAYAAYVGLGSSPIERPAPLDDHPPERVWQEADDLMLAWQTRTRGFTARIAALTDREERDYDHLSRLGEWAVTDPPEPVDLA